MAGNLLIERDKIVLNKTQESMLISGWSKEVYENTIVEKITYLSEGLKINGYIAYPAANDGIKFPCILWNRGGYKNKGVMDKFNARGIYGQLASWGYVVLSSQYRGSAGSEGKDELGGDDVNDILNIIPLADELPFADNEIWGIEGWSRGGLMSFLTLKQNKNFRCAVLSGAISNLKMNAAKNPETKKYYMELMGEQNIEEEMAKRSAITFTEKLPKIPYLLMHGLADDVVSPIQSIELSKKFYELNIPHRLVLFEEGDHYLKKHRKEVDELRRLWFEKYLKS